ncbi:DUF11 domain-containing protein [Candidatus Gottesmanbacteria bacterium]|nr:DUF11 domain-containing protein [Candidatus Gottesmanbacteria bacterium]
MKNLVKRAFIIWAAWAIFLGLSSSQISASAGCVPVYGGGVSCPRPAEVLLNKTVRNPATGVYVDNILPTDNTNYLPGAIVSYHIKVQNSGDETLSSVTVTDSIPSFTDFSSIDAGAENSNYDSNTRKLTFTVSNLSGNTSRTLTLNLRVVSEAALPPNKTLVCPINIVDAVSSNNGTDHDESQFCIQKAVEVPQIPKAGPEQWILSIIGLSASLFAGLKFRKKSVLS